MWQSTPTSKERVFNSDNIVYHFISRIANDNSEITGDMNLLGNFALNLDFWQHVFDTHDADRFEYLARALRISMVGLFYDRYGDTPEEVLNRVRIRDILCTAPRKNTVLADIVQHFTQLKDEVGVDLSHRASCACGYLNEESKIGQICPLCHTACGKTKLSDADKKFYDGVKNELDNHFAAHGANINEDFKRGPCGYLNSKKQFNDEPYRGHCGYLNPDLYKNLGMLREKGLIKPDTDPVKPPKWLTHLYTDQVENDGELPDKAKICGLLHYMIDYVASWSDCCDAHSSQQMKDMLPLLVRCKPSSRRKNNANLFYILWR